MFILPCHCIFMLHLLTQNFNNFLWQLVMLHYRHFVRYAKYQKAKFTKMSWKHSPLKIKFEVVLFLCCRAFLWTLSRKCVSVTLSVCMYRQNNWKTFGQFLMTCSLLITYREELINFCEWSGSLSQCYHKNTWTDEQTHTHAYTFNSRFPGKPWLAGCPLIFLTRVF